MNPEEHFRRLKDDAVWGSGSRDLTPVPAPRLPRAAARRRDRGPIWATGIVAAALTVLTVAALHAVPSTNGAAVGANAAPASESATAAETVTPTQSPLPSDTRSMDASDPSLRQFLFYPNDPADTARAKTIIACFKQHGVRIVGLEPAEGEPTAKGIAFGGPKNDHESIVKGLQFAKECFKAGGPVG